MQFGENLIQNSSSNVEQSNENSEIENTDIEHLNEDGSNNMENQISDQELDETSEDELKQEVEQEAEKENPIEISIGSKNSSIYKGYLYANATSTLKYETCYNTIETFNIINNESIDKILFVEKDSITLTTGDNIELEDFYYKESKVLVEEFDNILGDDGQINFYDEEGNYLGVMNSSSEIKNNYYVFEYSEKYNNIIFEIVNPINNGKINISNDKAIREEIEFTNEQVSLFDYIHNTINVSVVSENTVLNYESEGNISLEETESKMTMEIDNPVLSTEYPNKVAIIVSLKTDEEKYNLFSEPVIEIEFPNVVNNVELETINLLHKNGLSLNTWEIYTNESGNKVIRVSLSGTQMVYTPGSAAEETTLAIHIEVTNNILTSNGTQNLKLTYTNASSDKISYLERGEEAEEIELSFVGTERLISATVATNTNTNQSVVTYNDEYEKLETSYQDSELIQISGIVLNNFNSTVKNIQIVGSIPSTENSVLESYNIFSNFDTTLESLIEISGIEAQIYYSEKKDASKDDDCWTIDIDDINNYKSYKIVINSDEVKLGENIIFSYYVRTPENLGYNALSSSSYIVYYEYNGQKLSTISALGLETEVKESLIESISEEEIQEVNNDNLIEDTNIDYESENNYEYEIQNEEENEIDNEIPNNESDNQEESNNYDENASLSVSTRVSQSGNVLNEGDSVYERQVLKYSIVVQNDSNITATNIKIKANAKNSNIYDWYIMDMGESYWQEYRYLKQMYEYSNEEMEYVEFEIENLEPGESQTFEYQVIVKSLDEIEDNTVYGNIIISSDQIGENSIKTVENEIIDAELEILLEYSKTESLDGKEALTGVSNLFLGCYVKNISESKLNNVECVVYLPEGVSINYDMTRIDDDITYKVEEINEVKKITFDIPELKSGEKRNIYLTVAIESMDFKQESKEILITSCGEVNGNKYNSNDYRKMVYQGETRNRI